MAKQFLKNGVKGNKQRLRINKYCRWHNNFTFDIPVLKNLEC